MKYNNLKDVFFSSNFHVGKGMLMYDESLTGTPFNNLATMEDVVNNQLAITAAVNSEKSLSAMIGSDVALSHMANSQIAKEAIASAGVPIDLSGAPGNSMVESGDMDSGYFGEVSAEALFTGTELAALVGISEGASQFDDEGWLKLVIDGKIIFKSKKPFKHSISWDHINSKGCVDGTKKVTKNGVTYKVRLMKGGNGNVSDMAKGPKGSEWNRLMLPIHVKAKDQSWAYGANVDTPTPYWGIDFTDQDLHTHSSHGSGTYQWCQEAFHSNAALRVSRGYLGVSYSRGDTPSHTTVSFGWSPVLEVVA